MGAEIFQIQIGDNVKSIDSFSLNGSDLVLTVTTNKGVQVLTQSLFTLQETEIKDNVENYSELLNILNPKLNQFAYVRNSQGTPWLPGSIGGTYYASGLYIWDGVQWKEDDTDVFNQLEVLINNLNLEIQQRISSDNLLSSRVDVLENEPHLVFNSLPNLP